MILITIFMFVFVMKDLALYMHGRGKCLPKCLSKRFPKCLPWLRPASPLTTNATQETLNSPGKTFMSILCLAPLLGLHAPIFRLRFDAGWLTANYVLDQLDRNFVPFTSMLLSFVYCFTQKEYTRTFTNLFHNLTRLTDGGSVDSDLADDNTIHTIMTFNNSSNSLASWCLILIRIK